MSRIGYEGVTSTAAVPTATGAESGWLATPGQGKTRAGRLSRNTIAHLMVVVLSSVGFSAFGCSRHGWRQRGNALVVEHGLDLLQVGEPVDPFRRDFDANRAQRIRRGGQAAAADPFQDLVHRLQSQLCRLLDGR